MEYGKNNYVPPLFGSWTFGVPLIAKLVFDPPLHLLVCVCYSLVIYQPFTQSFSYFLWWRLCSFSSSSPFPGLNIARLFVCVVGNWSNSKPPPILLLGEGSGGWPPASQLPPVIIHPAWPWRCRERTRCPSLSSDIGQNMFRDCCFVVTFF